MNELIVRGRILAPHGIRGELRVEIRTDYPERMIEAERWLLRMPDGELREVALAQARAHQKSLLVSFEGVEERSEAELFRGAEIVVAPEELPALPEGEYYWFQLIGLEVVTVDGQSLGRIKDILRTGSNDVYVTDGPLIPAIPEVVEEVDLEARRMVIRPLPGLLD